MTYHVEFAEGAKRELKKLDKHIAAMLLGWIKKNLEGCTDPHIQGKGLTANRSGQWRYRVGYYRIIAEIDDGIVVILIIAIGHRRDIYN